MVLSDWGALRLSFTIVLCKLYSHRNTLLNYPRFPTCPSVASLSPSSHNLAPILADPSNHQFCQLWCGQPTDRLPTENCFPHSPESHLILSSRAASPCVCTDLTSGSRLKVLSYTSPRGTPYVRGLNSLLLHSYLSVIGETGGDAVSACPVDVGGWLLRWGWGGG